MTRWLSGIILLTLGSGLLADELPEPDRLDALVSRLGAEAHEDRREAFERLEAYADRFPRFMLLELADRYAAAADFEVRFRLESMLTPLAGEYLFGLANGFIGINMEWWEDDSGGVGVRVLSVLPDHAGEKAGLQQGDILMRVGEASVEELGTLQAFSDRIAGIPPGTIMNFTVLRGTDLLQVDFPLDARPDHLDASREGVILQIQAWLRGLSGGDEAEDPDFPTGHFPRDAL